MSDLGLGNIDFSGVDWASAFANIALAQMPSVNTKASPVKQTSNIRNTTGTIRMSTVLTNASTDVDMTFVFPFPSAQMQISDLSSSYVEIARPKYLPIVEFAGHKLMKFQIEFLLSHPGDGMVMPIDEHISFLRTMATCKQGIVFSNASGLLIDPLYYSGVTRTSNMMFHITDMSMNVQRYISSNAGIAAATVSLSFTEVRNPVLTVLKLPKIDYTPTKPKKKPGGKPPATGNQTTYSSTLGGNNGIIPSKIILTPAQKRALARAANR